MLRWFDLFDAILGARFTKAAGLILLCGWAPLLLMLPFLGPDANPIGLGLLAWFSTPVALVFGVMGVVAGYRRWHRSGQ